MLVSRPALWKPAGTLLSLCLGTSCLPGHTLCVHPSLSLRPQDVRLWSVNCRNRVSVPLDVTPWPQRCFSSGLGRAPQPHGTHPWEPDCVAL